MQNIDQRMRSLLDARYDKRLLLTAIQCVRAQDIQRLTRSGLCLRAWEFCSLQKVAKGKGAKRQRKVKWHRISLRVVPTEWIISNSIRIHLEHGSAAEGNKLKPVASEVYYDGFGWTKIEGAKSDRRLSVSQVPRTDRGFSAESSIAMCTGISPQGTVECLQTLPTVGQWS